MRTVEQHQTEIQQNRCSWQNKPLLQQIYRGFYARIAALINDTQSGLIVEIGSGIGNLKASVPRAVCTDLFPNPWLDLVCDGYELPFADRSVSHLVLFDVFHHLSAPRAFMNEARRVLLSTGRLILFEPYMSWSSYPVYGLLHHEPVARRDSINFTETPPRPRDYYAAQGNATRLFFSPEAEGWLHGWQTIHAEAFSAFSYLFSGGYSKPACYPERWLGLLLKLDAKLSRWPKLFGARCLVGLVPE